MDKTVCTLMMENEIAGDPNNGATWVFIVQLCLLQEYVQALHSCRMSSILVTWNTAEPCIVTLYLSFSLIEAVNCDDD